MKANANKCGRRREKKEELGQTCSLRDRYREMCYANTSYGYSWRADVSRASCRRRTNFLVPYATTLIVATNERARDVRDSCNIGTSGQFSAVEVDSRAPRDRLRYVSGWFCTDPACEYQELARPRG